MSKRLQVIVEDAEMRELQRLARRHHMTVAECVRQSLRAARRRDPGTDAGKRLKGVRNASRNEFPTGSIDRMLAEVEKGYLDVHS